MRFGFQFIIAVLLVTSCTKAPPQPAARNPHAAFVRKLARLESATEMGAPTDRLTQLAEDVRIEAKLVLVPSKANAALQDLQFRIELVRLDTLAANAPGCARPDLWTAQPKTSDIRSVNLARLHDAARDLRRVLRE